MKAVLVYHHKAVVLEHYILEMSIYQVGTSTKYPDGLKYRLIFWDRRSKRRVLMDNHHPKGPHIHLDNEEESYEFVDADTLISDFQKTVLKHMGVKI